MTVAADRFLTLDEVGLRRLAEANGVNVSYPRRTREAHEIRVHVYARRLDGRWL